MPAAEISECGWIDFQWAFFSPVEMDFKRGLIILGCFLDLFFSTGPFQIASDFRFILKMYLSLIILGTLFIYPL